MTKKIPTFLSVGETHNEAQRKYMEAFIKYVSNQGIDLETLGKTFWSNKNPLKPVQRKMEGVYGAAILAMERFHSKKGVYKEGSDQEKVTDDQYFATIWTHMEAAMAYQLELPLLILKDEKLVTEGMFDPMIHEWFIILINPSDPEELKRDPIKAHIDVWIKDVQKCYNSKKI